MQQIQRNKKARKWQISWKWKLFFFLLVPIQISYCYLCKWLMPPVTIIQLEAIVSSSRSFERTYVRKEQVSFHLYHALVASEDTKFARHSGFDVEGVKDALHNGIGGGSTLSQQVVKNAFLFKQPAHLRKLIELYLTPLVEKFWGKERILEVYVNIIEFEDGVFGIETASQKFYHKSAKDLTKQEATEIVSCIPNPKGCLRYRSHSPVMKKVQAHIRREMVALERDVKTMELFDRVTGSSDATGALKP
jgi:monofunctional glycosyltransferase